MINRRKLKREAKVAIGDVRPSPFWISLLFIVILILLNLLIMRLDGTLKAYQTMFRSAVQGELIYVEPQPLGGFMGQLLNIALYIMASVISLGFTLYALRVARHIHASAGDLFDVFGFFFRAILIQMLPSLMIGLWSMFYMLPVMVLVYATGQAFWVYAGIPLLIPAIRAFYSYRQAAYIMLDNPDTGCFECLAKSKAMMAGHKWELFKLDLSFLGWSLLCLIPIVGIPLAVWLIAYTQVTYARYYDAIGGTAFSSWEGDRG